MQQPSLIHAAPHIKKSLMMTIHYLKKPAWMQPQYTKTLILWMVTIISFLYAYMNLALMTVIDHHPHSVTQPW